MTRDEKVKYWTESAKNDWVVADHFFEKMRLSVCPFLWPFNCRETVRSTLCKKV